MVNEVQEIYQKKEEGLKFLSESTTKILELKKKVTRDFSQNVWNIGAELNRVKSEKIHLVKYNTWLEYLENEVKFSERSAQSFMKIANELDTNTCSDLSFSKCRLLVSFDEEKRKKVLEREDLKDMSYREFKDELKPKDNFTKDDKFIDGLISKIEEILDRLAQIRDGFKDIEERPELKNNRNYGALIKKMNILTEEVLKK